jgi:YEATS domain-containing protein 4
VPIGEGGVLGELTLATEQAEGDRLEEARRKVLAELEEWRAKLIANEREIGQLRRAVEGV